MKTLFIIRHAKSDQSFFGTDIERPLNERGLRDAPMMAKRIKERHIPIDAFVSSPAKRAGATAIFFALEYGKKERDIIFVPSLYHAPAEIFYAVIATLPDDIDAIAIFAHNPGITYFVNGLIPQTYVDNIPTCGVFAVEMDIDKWGNFAKADKTLLFFDYPKNIK